MAIKERQPFLDEFEPEFAGYDFIKPKAEISKFKQKIIKLGTVALAATLALANTDRALGQIIWRGNETKAHMLSEFAEKDSDNVWIIVPGLGVQSGQGIASVEKPTLEHTGSVGYLDFSDEGVDPYDAAQEITETLEEQQAKTVSFYGHSMGGTMLAEIVKYLPDRFGIKYIVLDCSPSSIYDAKNSFSATASKPAGIYGGGLLSKFGFELTNNLWLHKNNDLNTVQQIQDSWRVTVSGSSPRLFTNELKQLGTIDVSDSADRLKKAQAIYYVMPENEHADETVYTREAYERWSTKLGANIVKIIVKNGGHADDTDKPGEYAAALYPYLVLPFQESNQLENKRHN